MKYKLLLFDKDGYYKKAEHYTRELFAWASGKNWKMLIKGNSFKITEIK